MSRPTRPDSRRSSAGAGRQRVVLVLAGAVVVVLAVVIGVLTATESGSSPSVADIAGTPSVEGDPLPTAPADPSQDPAVGATAPVVTGTDFDGEGVTLGDPGRPQLITFMASWCPHCQDELPEVGEWIASGEVPEELRVTTVITSLDDSRPNWPPDVWLEDEAYPGPVLVDDAASSVAQAFGLPGTPYWVALDAEGTVRFRVAGRLGMDAVRDVAAALVAGA